MLIIEKKNGYKCSDLSYVDLFQVFNLQVVPIESGL